MIIHNGSQVKVLNTYKQSVDFINNQLKSTKKRIHGRKKQKRRDALDYFMKAKPDTALRQCAHNQKCFNELMEWRSEILEHLDRRRNEEFF